MSGFSAFVKKELLELVRSGRLAVLVLVFFLFGVMNPAVAKLTPWMMELMAQSLAETGLQVTQVQVDALTAWTQYFKNLPMALIIFALLHSGSFTREYQSGTLVLMLTRGLERWKVLAAKTGMLLLSWSVCYGLCFAVTYGYSAWFWDNGIARHLAVAAVCWWLFGVWVIALLVLCSTLARSGTGVLLGTLGGVLLAWLLTLFPQTSAYSPARLMGGMALVSGGEMPHSFGKAICITVLATPALLLLSVPCFNKKRL